MEGGVCLFQPGLQLQPRAFLAFARITRLKRDRPKLDRAGEVPGGSLGRNGRRLRKLDLLNAVGRAAIAHGPDNQNGDQQHNCGAQSDKDFLDHGGSPSSGTFARTLVRARRAGKR